MVERRHAKLLVATLNGPQREGSQPIRNGLPFMRAQIVTFSQDFCHHGDTICHPKSSYVTSKLNGMSTCGCNNNAICSDKAIVTFPTVDVNWPQQSTGGACQSSEMAAVLNSLSVVFNNLFLPKYV